jgi:hypothetical protein
MRPGVGSRGFGTQKLSYLDFVQVAGRSKALLLVSNVEHSSKYFVYLLMMLEKRAFRFQSALIRLVIRS